jgi:isoleucyl-tRNA synthetase
MVLTKLKIKVSFYKLKYHIENNYKESIHFLNIPHANEQLINTEIVTSVNHMQKIVELARQLRDTEGIPLKRPVRSVTIINSSPEVSESLNLLKNYFKSEINTLEINEASNIGDYVTYEIDFNHRSLGQRLGKQYNNNLRNSIKNMSKSQLDELMSNSEVEIDGVGIFKDDLYLIKVIKQEAIEHSKQT